VKPEREPTCAPFHAPKRSASACSTFGGRHRRRQEDGGPHHPSPPAIEARSDIATRRPTRAGSVRRCSATKLDRRHAYAEETPFHPQSPYAIAKLFAFWIVNNYRASYGMFCANGILFNHESPIRGKEFVTRKISYNVAKIRLGLSERFALGNLDSRRDWDSPRLCRGDAPHPAARRSRELSFVHLERPTQSATF